MPIYEYQCNNGHLTELIFPSYEASKSVIVCTHKHKGKLCRYAAERVYSLTTMKPDSCWNGKTTPTGEVVFSEKEYQEATKNIVPYTRDNKEYVEKRKQDAIRDMERKKTERRDKFFSSIANDIDLPS